MKENKEKKENNPGKPEKEAQAMKAIGYAAGMYVDQKGNVIDTKKQIQSITDYAARNGMELVTVYEDMDESEFVLNRAGVRKMLGEETDAEVVLVDRVWCIGRTRAAVEPLLLQLDGKGVRLEAAEMCFDVTSQFTRFWYEKPENQAYKVSRKARELDRKAPSPTTEAKV